MTASRSYRKKSSFSLTWNNLEQTHVDFCEPSHQILDPLRIKKGNDGLRSRKSRAASSCRVAMTTGGRRSRMDPRFHRRKSTKTLAKKRSNWTFQINESILLQTRVGVHGRWAELQSDVAEGLCIQAEGEKHQWEDGRKEPEDLFFGCQRKSVWCASSSRKCIDVRHRHSSPPPAERLTVAHPVCFFFKCPSARNM